MNRIQREQSQPITPGERVELIPEQVAHDDEPKLQQMIGLELTVIGVTCGAGRVYVKNAGLSAYVRPDQVRRVTSPSAGRG